jgi:U2 small nuclear ribonucleoprotein B''
MQRIQFSKQKSDILFEMEGVAVDKTGRQDKRKQDEATFLKKINETKKTKKDTKQKDTKKFEATANPLQPKIQPPNNILFVENLPDNCTDSTLAILFQQYAGFREVRLPKPGIAFVEFENEVEAGIAMKALQHYKITPTNLVVISYAKK